MSLQPTQRDTNTTRQAEHYQHDKCQCGTPSVPAESVPDQTLRGCPKCHNVWWENLDAPPKT